MKIKIKENIKLELEQLEEFAMIMQTPDMGWEVNSQNEKLDKIYLVEYQGDCGKYLYRVNNSRKLLTLLKVSN
jgi:hypothetical protein